MKEWNAAEKLNFAMLLTHFDGMVEEINDQEQHEGTKPRSS